MNGEKPGKPLVIYDGECGFCRRSVAGWESTTGDRVDFAPFQEVADRFPQIPTEEFQRSVQFIDADKRRYAGAEAVFRILAHAPGRGWLLFLYRWLPGFALLSRIGYRFIARHRSSVASPAWWLWGDHLGPSTFRLSRGLFLRALGVVYLIAFVSYGVQVLGLNGSHGILPASDFIEMVRRRFGSDGFWMVPSLCWWRCDDWFLKWFFCGGGALASALLILGILPALMLIVQWAFYLSLVSVGGDFMHFQWDLLLLEAGFLAILYAPLTVRLSSPRAGPPSHVVNFLIKWLLFRLMFESGVVKLTAGDDCWQKLTALTFHYETQPLPTWTAWYAHHLPLWFQKTSVVMMFAVELVIPFFLFAPRRFRHAACAAIVGLMAIIGATGNYNFFNLLTVLLCVASLDDALLSRLAWPNLRKRLATPPAPKTRYVRRAGLAALAAFVLLISAFNGLRYSSGHEPLPRWVHSVAASLKKPLNQVAAFRSINSYGLFRVMTKTRPEIVVEGSNDGRTWLPYEFKWKPGDLNRAPTFVEPHQPRLDWQMWFAALGSYKQNPWFGNFLRRLLEGSPDVLALMESNPFPDAPPRYIRAVRNDYHFSDVRARNETGAWWTRTFLDYYSPTVSLPRR